MDSVCKGTPLPHVKEVANTNDKNKKNGINLKKSKTMITTLTRQELINDSLPVVELKPFLRKEWRPAKSLPEQLERSSSSLSLRSQGPKSARSVDYDIPGYPNPQKVVDATPRHDFDTKEFCTKVPNNDRHIFKGHKLPTKECVFSAENQHPYGFATQFGREKTTSWDLRNGTSLNIYFTNNLKWSETEVEFYKPKDFKVSGQRIHNVPPPRYSALYGSPWTPLTRTKTFHEISPNVERDNKRDKKRIMDDLNCKIDSIENIYKDEDIYDTFDRSNTLPSLKVANAPMKRRPKGRQKSGKIKPEGQAYQLGVTNSLDILSQFGQPAGIEKHLTIHLKHSLGQLKRSREKNNFSSTASKAVQQYDFVPTVGELCLQSALVANTKQEGKGLKGKRIIGLSRSRALHLKSESSFYGSGTTGFKDDFRTLSPSKSIKSNTMPEMNSKLGNGTVVLPEYKPKKNRDKSLNDSNENVSLDERLEEMEEGKAGDSSPRSASVNGKETDTNEMKNNSSVIEGQTISKVPLNVTLPTDKPLANGSEDAESSRHANSVSPEKYEIDNQNGNDHVQEPNTLSNGTEDKIEVATNADLDKDTPAENDNLDDNQIKTNDIKDEEGTGEKVYITEKSDLSIK